MLRELIECGDFNARGSLLDGPLLRAAINTINPHPHLRGAEGLCYNLLRLWAFGRSSGAFLCPNNGCLPQNSNWSCSSLAFANSSHLRKGRDINHLAREKHDSLFH